MTRQRGKTKDKTKGKTREKTKDKTNRQDKKKSAYHSMQEEDVQQKERHAHSQHFANEDKARQKQGKTNARCKIKTRRDTRRGKTRQDKTK